MTLLLKTATRIGALACLTGALVGCGKSASTEQLLVGKWDCQMTMDGVVAAMDVEYLADGRSTAMFDMTAHDEASGVELSLNGVVVGKWSLKETTLTEEVTKGSVSSAFVNGQEVDAKMVESQFIEPLVGAPTTSEIELINDKRMLVTDPDSSTTCTRR